MNKVEEKSLQQMETLLHHSIKGIHILFDNRQIAQSLTNSEKGTELSEQEKIQKVQSILVKLINKRSYTEKIAYLNELDRDSYDILIRTYFSIVENTIRNLKGYLFH